MLFKKKQDPQSADTRPERYARSKPTKSQRKAHILLIVFVVLFILGICAYRYPLNYVNMFIGHYDGTTSILEELKGLKRSDEERASLLPLQQSFDDWKETHLRDDVTVTASDGTELAGGLYDAGSKVTVVLLHSFDGSSSDTDYLYADYYARKGYNILLPDSRAHGESGGSTVTYGRDEGGDVICWVELLRDTYGTDSKVIFHGDTLGANAALVGAAQMQKDSTLSDMVSFVVAESPISNLYDEAVYLTKNQLSLPGVLVQLGDIFASRSLGTSMEDIDLMWMTEGRTVPTLFIQSDGDTVVDPRAVKGFYDDYAGEKQSVFVTDSAHGMVYAEHQSECEEAIDEMIESYLK